MLQRRTDFLTVPEWVIQHEYHRQAGRQKGVFNCEPQSGASGYCSSMLLYEILWCITTGMSLKGAVMSTVCLCMYYMKEF